MLKRNDVNGLNQDSIVKCDDLIELAENEIQFKIGEVSQADLDKFVDTYSRYLDENYGEEN